jgi:hypothetical protein
MRWPWVALRQHGQQLLHLAALLATVPAGDRTLDTVLDVILEHLVLHTT